MVTVRPVSQSGRHHWTDWVGIAFFLLLAFAALRRSPVLGIMVLPLYFCDVVVAISFLVRRPAKARLVGWRPRIFTYGGSFLIQTFLVLAEWLRPSWLALTPATWAVRAGYGVWLVGLILNSCAVWHLRHCFSLSPTARELVRSGPYRFARHPIYVTHVLMCIGIMMGHFTLPVAITILVWLSLMSGRVHYEEMVLEAAFPEYAQYRQQVGRFGLRWYSMGAAEQKPVQLPPTP